MKTLEDEQYVVIKAYKCTVSEIWRDSFVLAYIACTSYPYIQSLPTVITARYNTLPIMASACMKCVRVCVCACIVRVVNRFVMQSITLKLHTTALKRSPIFQPPL